MLKLVKVSEIPVRSRKATSNRVWQSVAKRFMETGDEINEVILTDGQTATGAASSLLQACCVKHLPIQVVRRGDRLYMRRTDK